MNIQIPNMKRWVFSLLFSASILLNVVLVAAMVYQTLDGCAEIASGRIGILAEDVKVGYFGGVKTIFELPKGLVVREASATGAGWFEPYRFRIVVTSDNASLVDYTIDEEQLDGQDSEYYSAERR